MKRRNFFLAAGIFAVLITALMMIGNVFSLIDHVSLLLVAMALLLTSAGDSWRGLFAAIAAGLKAKDMEREAGLQHLTSLKSFENLVLICGAAVSLAGNIGAMALLKTPELIGPFVAMALTGAFTAVFVSRLLVFPLRLRIKCLLGSVPEKFAPGFWPDLALIGFPLISYLTINMIIFSF
jgi:hypothetical protein